MRIPKSSVPLGENPALPMYSRQTQGRATDSPCQARQHFPCSSSWAHSASRGSLCSGLEDPSHRAGRNISAPTFSTLSFQSSSVKPDLAIYSVLPHIRPGAWVGSPCCLFPAVGTPSAPGPPRGNVTWRNIALNVSPFGRHLPTRIAKRGRHRLLTPLDLPSASTFSCI